MRKGNLHHAVNGKMRGDSADKTGKRFQNQHEEQCTEYVKHYVNAGCPFTGNGTADSRKDRGDSSTDVAAEDKGQGNSNSNRA